METQAAIATAAGQPLAIDTVHLDGPREGEALIEIKLLHRPPILWILINLCLLLTVRIPSKNWSKAWLV